MDNPAKVLVVGCGPAGLTAALTLAQSGVSVRVIEKEISERVGQRGAGISPRSLELFEGLGVVEELQKQGISTPPVRSYAAIGNLEAYKEFIMVPYEAPTPAQPYRNFLILGQDNLDKIMRRKLCEYGISIDYGTELVSLEHLDNQVKVILEVKHSSSEGGPPTQVEEVYEYVIGADGARGTVRKQLDLPFLGDSLEIKMAIGDIRVEGLSDKYWHMWGKMEGSLFLGIRGTENPGVFNFIIGGSTFDQGKEITQNHELLKSFLSEHSFGIRDDIKITQVICAAPYTPSVRMVDEFSKGNVFVAGDAAHIHSPAGAQGMNTGIQDGFNLAWKLAMVCKGWSRKALLDTYNEERLPVVSQMLNITNGLMAAMASSTNEASGWKRSGNGVNQLGVNYRWSPIVADEGKKASKEQEASARNAYDEADSLRAGDRAPDAPELRRMGTDDQQVIRLFKLLSPTRHSVLILSSSLEDIRRVVEVVKKYPSGAIKAIAIVRADAEINAEIESCEVYRDIDGHAYEAYSKAEGKANFVVIRPDGVIGAIAENVEWVDKYFTGVLL